MAKESCLGIYHRPKNRDREELFFSMSCVEWEACNGETKKHRKRKCWCIFFSSDISLFYHDD